MAYTTKTTIGERNIVVQTGVLGFPSRTVWLEVENHDHQATQCVALEHYEARSLGLALLAYSAEAKDAEKGNVLAHTG